jgi:hypothetical protein
MTWLNEFRGWWAIGVVGGGALGAAIMWWALADLFFATVEVPFIAMLERWRQRVWWSDDEPGGDAGAPAHA